MKGKGAKDHVRRGNLSKWNMALYGLKHLRGIILVTSSLLLSYFEALRSREECCA
jgi:hypothetical protein